MKNQGNRESQGVISSGHPGNPSKSTQNHEKPCKIIKKLSKSTQILVKS